MKHLLIAFSLLALSIHGFAQGPLFRQTDFWSMNAEDLSDVVRKYPAMVPLDYGTIGAPMLFRPWNMQPWTFRVERDGLLQNRINDGLYDANLQPLNEVDSLRYDFLAPGAAGRFHFNTRTLPVDSPVTEFQIREGYYGLSTVDFAHAQRVYKSASLEITGHLMWYDGMRSQVSGARETRVRGRFGIDLNPRWRSEITWATSNDSARFVLNPSGFYSEQADGDIRVFEKNSAKSALSPSLNLFLRQDRDNWVSAFHSRELSRGWMLNLRKQLPSQTISLKQTSSLTTLNCPGYNERNELLLEAMLTDSLDFKWLQARAMGQIQRESIWLKSKEEQSILLPDLSISLSKNIHPNFSIHGGAGYASETAPVSFRLGHYLVLDRPILIAPEFRDPTFTYASRDAIPHIDHFLKTIAGMEWKHDDASIQMDILTMSPKGNRTYSFERDTSIYLDYGDNHGKSQVGFAAKAQVPIKYGLRIDSWWSAQYDAGNLNVATERRGFTRLYFERAFFRAPLTIRSYLSWEHVGQHVAYSDQGTYLLGPDNVVGFRLSATIRGVTLIWGTENLLNEKYSLLPGYKMIGKEEYLAFIWRLWL